MYSGFEGARRSGLIEWDMPGACGKGLLNLLSGKPFKLGDVPPLPPDVVSWTMTNFDFGRLLRHRLSGRRAYRPPDFAGRSCRRSRNSPRRPTISWASICARIFSAHWAIGSPITTRQAMDRSRLGQTVLFKVKDAGKAVGDVGADHQEPRHGRRQTSPNQEARLSRRDIHEVYVQQQGFIFVPTYAIHKGWLGDRLLSASGTGVRAAKQGRIGGLETLAAGARIAGTSCPRNSSPSPTAIRGRRSSS